MKKILAAVFVAWLGGSAWAQEHELEKLSGYVDFGDLADTYGEPKVMINIGGTLLKLISAVADEGEAEEELLKNLQGVRVNVYSTEGRTEPALAQIERVKAILQKDQWEPIVQVKEEDEDVQIFVMADAETIRGLMVMAVNEEEAVFLNILGMIDPARLGEVVEKLNVPVDL